MSHDAPPAPVSPAVLREVLGHFVSGIVVVTAAGREFDPAAGREIDTAAGRGGPLGFTCQSFASLSLDPPLVSLAPARTSSTWPRIRAVGAFCVNVLAAEHEDVSVAFARSGVDKFAGVAWTPAPSGAPVLHGVSAWVDCELWAEYDGGDHTIAVGRVLDLSADPTRPPLLYYRGRYGIAASEN
jgi:3-hydroxy-9,10-secoandrosta-1,3,5(10)-triene-9,17-dione monooxygenase reductase component